MSGGDLGLLRTETALAGWAGVLATRVRDRYRPKGCADIEALYTELLAPRRDLRATLRPRPWDPALKRLFDVTLATAGLVGSAPLWGLAALAIKLEDGGPVFFGQERWGQHGRRMRVLKFRTMITNANPAGVTVQAAKGDPRITRVGRVLRATAFDEIPQLLNIWKGEMSFVGPRVLPINERQGREETGDLPDEKIRDFTSGSKYGPDSPGSPRSSPPEMSRAATSSDMICSTFVGRASCWICV